jgi:hypothetical protein
VSPRPRKRNVGRLLLLSTTSCGDILPVSRSARLVDVVELNDSATITVAVRAPQNLALLRRGGATSVITSSESAADCWSCQHAARPPAG